MITENHSNPIVQKIKEAGPWALSTVSLGVAMLALSLNLMGNAQFLPGHNTAQLLSNSTGSSRFQLASSVSAGDRSFFSGSANVIADVAQDIAPSVVNIDIKRNSRVVQRPMPYQDDLFQRFFGFSPGPGGPIQMFQGRTPAIRGNGSGVIISADGKVLTNNHVVNGADDIVVTLNDGRKFPAKVVGKDPFSDLAVLSIQGATNLKPAKLGVSQGLRPGEWVIAVGSPLGFDHTVTLGIVSALSRQVPDINSNVEFIQTDAAINPGNSGGPLVNLNGEVIGINTAIAGSGQNIGFAIPVDTVKKVTKELIAGGHITRPWVGLSMAPLNPELAKSLGLLTTVKGVVVAEVLPDSPSERAGFLQGDVIQRMNGTPVISPKQVQDYIRSKPVNSELSFQILRNGQLNALTLKTEALPDAVANPAEAEDQPDMPN